MPWLQFTNSIFTTNKTIIIVKKLFYSIQYDPNRGHITDKCIWEKGKNIPMHRNPSPNHIY